MMLEIKTLFDLGDTVYFITDEDQRPHIVTQISIRENGYIKYECSRVGSIDFATACEITKEKVIV